MGVWNVWEGYGQLGRCGPGQHITGGDTCGEGWVVVRGQGVAPWRTRDQPRLSAPHPPFAMVMNMQDQTIA